MSDLNMRRIPNDYAMAMLTTGWKITKMHYAILFGSSLIVAAIAVAVSMIPYLGILGSIPALFLGVGQMHIVRSIIEGKPVKYSDVFHVFENQRWMNALLPLGIAGVAIALVQVGITKYSAQAGAFGGMSAALISLMLSLTWAALTAFSGPLIAFQGQTFQQSIDHNIKVTVLNWWPLLIFTFLMAGLLFFCAILFFLPVIFVFLPLAFVTAYLCYASMFEGLDVVALGAMFDTKPTL